MKPKRLFLKPDCDILINMVPPLIIVHYIVSSFGVRQPRCRVSR
jgi:hypothetical protein